MFRALCVSLCFLALFFAGPSCNCPQIVFPESRQLAMIRALEHTFQGELLAADGTRTSFSLRLAHDPTLDILAMTRCRFFRSAFAFSCGRPQLGVTGRFTSNSPFLPNMTVGGVFQFFGAGMPEHLDFSAPTRLSSANHFQISIANGVFVSGRHLSRGAQVQQQVTSFVPR